MNYSHVSPSIKTSVRMSRLMDEDCISMKNEPIDPLDMQFDFDGEDGGGDGQLFKDNQDARIKTNNAATQDKD